MGELIDLYNRDGEAVVPGLTFKEAIDEIETQHIVFGESNVGVAVVHLWLARTEGIHDDPVLILQQRSDNHRLDKAVGGHISSDLTDDNEVAMAEARQLVVTARQLGEQATGVIAAKKELAIAIKGGIYVAQEMSEELGGVNFRIIDRQDEKVNVSALDLTSEVVAWQSGFDPWQLSGRHDRGRQYYVKPTIVTTFDGLYDGPLKFDHDFEVDTVVEMPYSEIAAELSADPDTDHFTPDLKSLVHGVAERFRSLKLS